LGGEAKPLRTKGDSGSRPKGAEKAKEVTRRVE
jgi:hypothetical protein